MPKLGQIKVGIIRALQECIGVSQWAPCPRRARSQGRPGPVASQDVDSVAAAVTKY